MRWLVCMFTLLSHNWLRIDFVWNHTVFYGKHWFYLDCKHSHCCPPQHNSQQWSYYIPHPGAISQLMYLFWIFFPLILSKFQSDDRVSTELKKNIMQARMDKKYTQGQLAQVCLAFRVCWIILAYRSIMLTRLTLPFQLSWSMRSPK